ncbi:MAG: hypothetical protein ACK4NF_00665 [Planctomycetota bacterium]
MNKENTILLGLSIPAFIASLVTLFVGVIGGLIGIWAYLVWKLAVPEYIKVGHAHTAWWSAFILLASLLLPQLHLKQWFKKFSVWTFLLAPLLWIICLSVYYISKAKKGVVSPVISSVGDLGAEYLVYGTGIFVMEVWFFAVFFLIVLSAVGGKIPFIYSPESKPQKYDLISDIEIPRKIFWIPLIFGILGILAGWYMTVRFKLFHKPISPAAIVQFHSHILFFVVGFQLVLIIMKAVGVKDTVFKMATKLGTIAIPLTYIGYIGFIKLNLHSIIYVIPAVVYYVFLFLGLITTLGKFGMKIEGGPGDYIRGTMTFVWVLLLFLVSIGFLIALKWDTKPDITVTFKQPEGIPYPGSYPQHYIGTEPVAHTPRGLENAHLSPGSWSHIALLWLVIMLIFGQQIFETIGKPNLLFLIVTTIPLAPFFNAVGRFAAWLDLPYGIGPHYFAGQPLKTFNIIFLFIVSLVLISRLKHKN